MAQTYYEELQQFLPGLSPDMPDSCMKLAELFRAQAFELHIRTWPTGEEKYYIPYMMNDALECLLILEQCRMTGRYLVDFKGTTQAHMAKDGEVYLLVVRQGDDNVFTIWFSSIREEMTCYQYHRIGHFWVKGQEQWRRLVYIVGTLYDKYSYMGDTVCTQAEKELRPLMELAPFRAFSPVKESLDEEYPDTLEGVECMKKLALEAGDWRLAHLLKVYRRFPFPWAEKRIQRHMESRAGIPLYEVLYRKTEAASKVYPIRDYGRKSNEETEEKRRAVSRKLQEKGFTGAYPFFRKGSMQILAMEEHPFTLLEAEDFSFRIQFMVSVSKKDSERYNGGFFKGRQNRGWIEKNLDFLGGKQSKGEEE